jgi:hypothetical protein
MKLDSLAGVAASCALALALVACGKPSSYAQELLTEASGIKVTAENAAADSGALSESAVVVPEGGTIVISPCLDSGSFHVSITSADGASTVYDDKADGRIMFTVPAAPGTYTVNTSAATGTTGWMTVFAMQQSELDQQDAALSEALQKEGLGPKEVLS